MSKRIIYICFKCKTPFTLESQAYNREGDKICRYCNWKDVFDYKEENFEPILSRFEILDL